MDVNNNFVVVTGGPGSGKSTLIAALQAHGVSHMPEAGRAIIQDQVAIGGSALPWDDKAAFAEMMLVWEMRSYREAQRLTGTVLFDRGVPDVIGYLELSGIPVSAHIVKAADIYRYHRKVFIAPYWSDIYAKDDERKQSVEEAQATYAAMVKAYSARGYELIPLPLASVSQRVEFVLETLKSVGVAAV